MSQRLVQLWLAAAALLAESVSGLASARSVASGAAGSGVASNALLQRRFGPGGSTIELPPDQLVTYIATGQLPNSAAKATGTQGAAAIQSGMSKEVDPYATQAKPILEYLQEYAPRLDEVRAQADAMYNEVQQKEALLQAQFQPEQKKLEAQVKAAVDEASKAEAETMLERLTRMHYQELAVLERSARYWEERIKCEKELSYSAEVQARLEREKVRENELDAALQTQDMMRVRNEEKARLNDWVLDFEKRLQQEERKSNPKVALLELSKEVPVQTSATKALMEKVD